MSSDNLFSAEVRQDAEQGAVGPNVGADSVEAALSGAGFSYRHNWGSLRGQQTLRLNWGAINPRSHVFVSISEGAAGGPNNGKFIGAARFTVHNVAPRAGGVDVWVNIEWGANIPLYVDYLVINPPGARTVQVTVHRHSTVSMSNAEADRILRDMGNVLQSSDSAADVATQVSFVRNGSVRVLPSTVPATIQTQAHLNALFAAGTGVKVVRSIRWCGGPGGSIIGCAPVGSPVVNIGVVPFTDNQEGILWVHEYGHNTGSGHRTDDGRAVMFPSIASDHNVVNSTESGRYLTGPLAITRGPSAMKSSCGHGATPEPPDDVLEFVSQHWIEGIPRDAASQYNEEDARRLLDWLVNEPDKHEEFLPEIVTTLGFIGSEVAVRPLIDFVESPGSSQAIFNAKNAALIHLGDLARKSGSEDAVRFLARVASDMKAAKSLSAPEVSRMAAAGNTASPDAEDLSAELAVSATMGLSLAGTAKAKQILDSLVSDTNTFAAVNQAALEMVNR